MYFNLCKSTEHSKSHRFSQTETMALTINVVVQIKEIIYPLFLSTNLNSESESAEKKDSMEMLKATVNHMKDRRQLLLIPITVYSGFEQAFLWSDYTRVCINDM